MPRLPLSTPLPVLPLIRAALDLAEAGWVEADGDKDELAQVGRDKSPQGGKWRGLDTGRNVLSAYTAEEKRSDVHSASDRAFGSCWWYVSVCPPNVSFSCLRSDSRFSNPRPTLDLNFKAEHVACMCACVGVRVTLFKSAGRYLSAASTVL